MNQSNEIGELAKALAQAQSEIMPHKNFKDLSGKRFNGWLVLNRGPNAGDKTRYFCRCDCGNECLIYAVNLTTEKSKHCLKCFQKYRTNYHGMSKSNTYSVYIQMIERCHNTNHKYYKYYGERGIFVCDEWKESFKYFLRDMGEAPEGLSIDRIDNDQGYFKENCRWTTKKEQQQNRRTSIKLGEICNEWEVTYRYEGEKAYTIRCVNCHSERKILSCNFRRKQKCECQQECYNG